MEYENQLKEKTERRSDKEIQERLDLINFGIELALRKSREFWSKEEAWVRSTSEDVRQHFELWKNKHLQSLEELLGDIADNAPKEKQDG